MSFASHHSVIVKPHQIHTVCVDLNRSAGAQCEETRANSQYGSTAVLQLCASAVCPMGQRVIFIVCLVVSMLILNNLSHMFFEK